ncbi:MAG: hypothetical protein DHS20C16_20080 [Phycisphaerae bacterium]|nr:MAG: hypothetical protein DHS20C16_20080 [Phycisphaerae bacterium]
MNNRLNSKVATLGMWMLAGGTLFSGCHGSLKIPFVRGEFSSAGAFVDFVGGALAVTDDGVFLDFPNGFVEVSDDGVFVDAPGVNIEINDRH